mmetsp:Transcript_12573/g.26496  ORF Transcript_12573/g.26496 Transcript_12573/m.26496 type:complete len:200 (-) Transcript_12573:331-930(-)
MASSRVPPTVLPRDHLQVYSRFFFAGSRSPLLSWLVCPGGGDNDDKHRQSSVTSSVSSMSRTILPTKVGIPWSVNALIWDIPVSGWDQYIPEKVRVGSAAGGTHNMAYPPSRAGHIVAAAVLEIILEAASCSSWVVPAVLLIVALFNPSTISSSGRMGASIPKNTTPCRCGCRCCDCVDGWCSNSRTRTRASSSFAPRS